MTPLEVTDICIILGVPVLITRLIVGLSHPRRVSRLWTFALPTGVLLLFFLRVSITRNLEIIRSDDWISSASWAAVVLSQAMATIYQWTPEILFSRRR